MNAKMTNIWIWLQSGSIFKSVSSCEDGTICVYDERDQMILKRSGLTKLQIRQIEHNIMRYGARKINKNAEPFKFLGK